MDCSAEKIWSKFEDPTYYTSHLPQQSSPISGFIKVNSAISFGKVKEAVQKN